MNRPTICACASLVALAVTTPAHADGLPGGVKDYPSAAASPRLVSCYFGAYGSGAFIRSAVDVAVMATDTTQGASLVGGGPEVGCDVILGQFTIGALADYTFQSGKESNSVLGLTATSPFGNEGAVLGRLGVYTNSAHHTLLYGVGGVAFAPTKSMTMVALPAVSMPFSGGTAIVIGGGIETVLSANASGSGGWNGFVEYRHESYDTRTGTLLAVIPTKVDTTEDKVMTGLRYRF